MTTPFEIANHISSKESFEFEISEYQPWLMNKIFSNTKDSLFFADEMNKYHHLDKKIQYEFYYQGLPKAKRFGKWTKMEENVDIDFIMGEMKCNRQTAFSYVKLIKKLDIESIRMKQITDKGGKT